MNKESWKKIGLWLSVIPVAALGFFLGGIVANILFGIQRWFLGVGPESGYAKITYYVISSAISAGAGVYFGAKVAPSHRKIVSMALAAVVVGLSAINVLFSLSGWQIVSSLSSIIASGYVVYNFFEQGEEFSFSD